MSSNFTNVKRYSGVQYYTSSKKKINGKPDKCYYITYKNLLRKSTIEKIGWQSEGISAIYAFKIRSERVRKIRLGDEVITIQQRRKSSISFADFVERQYLPHCKINKKEHSYIQEKQLLTNWINPVIGNKSLQAITVLDIESIKNKMLSIGRSPRTVEYTLAIVRQVFNAAIDWNNFKGENPVKKINIPKEDNRRVRFLSKDEVILLLSECKKKSGKMYEVVLLSVSTGLRAGEIANLKWQDIDLENKMIAVKDTKNNMNRIAYMTEKIYAIFKDKKACSPDDYIFTDMTGKKPKNIARTISFRKITKQLGFNDGITDRRNKVVFHTLRHTFASWLAISGVPIYTIKELMGHKTIAMTERYAHLIPDTKRDAVKNIDKIMAE